MTTQSARTSGTTRTRSADRTADLTTAVASLTHADRQLRRQAAGATGTPASAAWEGRYRALFETLSDASFFTDAAGIIQEANHSASRLVGFARTYCLAKPLAAYILPADAPRFRETLAQAVTLSAGKSLLGGAL